MVYVYHIISCILVVEAFLLTKPLYTVNFIVYTARQSLKVLGSPNLTDDEKAMQTRRMSLALFKGNFILLFKIAVIAAIAAAPYLILHLISPETAQTVWRSYGSITVLIILTLAAVAYAWVRSSLNSGGDFLDHLLHRIAFSSRFVQRSLKEFEDNSLRSEISRRQSEREVFITGLPRAGTTMLLEFLYQTGEFRTWTYRHMPFVLSPIIWRRISKPFRQQGKERERAHKDGMKVSYDSPEAFEEIIWLYYLENKIVKGDRIVPLSEGDQTPEFEKGFRETAVKLLIGPDGSPEPGYRYLSKNNANISRLELLKRIFPTCAILVCFRAPLAQAASLLKQHRQFSALHEKDKYARDYMRWLGHYDFGLNFKPMDFNHWLDHEDPAAADTPGFWLRYWTAAYSFVLSNPQDRVCLVDFDEMLANGSTVLDALAGRLELRDRQALNRMAETLRAPTSRPLMEDPSIAAELERAREVHQALKALAIR